MKRSKSKRYTDEQISWLRTWYRHFRVFELTRRYNRKFGENRSPNSIKSSIQNHHIKLPFKRGRIEGKFIYTARQIGYLRKFYKKYSCPELTKRFNASFGLNEKVPRIRIFIHNHGIRSGRTGCFLKGIVPWNKGKNLPFVRNAGNFKKGHVPANKKPLGHTRVDTKDGYLLINVNELNPYTGFPTRFRPKHHVLWEKYHGKKIPSGTVIMFRDGNKRNFSRRNLVCITKAQNARLNQLHYSEQPAELKPSIFILAMLKDQLGEVRRNGSVK